MSSPNHLGVTCQTHTAPHRAPFNVLTTVRFEGLLFGFHVSLGESVRILVAPIAFSFGGMPLIEESREDHENCRQLGTPVGRSQDGLKDLTIPY